MNRVAGLRSGRDALLVFVALTLIAALTAFGLGTVRPAGAQATTVSMTDFAFGPASITITAGSTVTWVNNGAVAHTATGSGFDTGSVAAGASASFTFDTPGTYSYVCSFHPQMTGTIVVTGATDGGDDDDDTGAPTPTTSLPNTGAGVDAGSRTTLSLAAGLLAVVALLGIAGMAVLRRADR